MANEEHLAQLRAGAAAWRGMANEEHLAQLRAGAAAWNVWRKEHPDVAPVLSGADLRKANLGEADLGEADLYEANLSGADLSGADLSGANLVLADLSGATLSRADLGEANLSGANLICAHLSGAHLSKANLSGANLVLADLREADLSMAYLSEADLTWAKLSEVNLSGADLSRADLYETIFVNVDLSATKGLDACTHKGPSVLDHRTLQQSRRLPLAFLRGCGLPDRLIDYLPSLLNEAIQFYSCFISYSSKDDAFAKRLHEGLQNNGVRCWFAPHDLPIGAKTRDAIDEAIRLRDKVLLILSKHAIASDWVEDEVTKGFAEERHRNQLVLFPVRIDDTVMKTGEAWAVKLHMITNLASRFHQSGHR